MLWNVDHFQTLISHALTSLCPEGEEEENVRPGAWSDRQWWLPVSVKQLDEMEHVQLAEESNGLEFV